MTDLDFDAADRQAMGYGYNRQIVRDLLKGRMRTPPHPEWKLPETIDWLADPLSDKNWRFQYHMLRWLDPLRRAAVRGDDAAYGMWLRYVRDWVDKNPPGTKSQSPDAWKDMSDGLRAIHFSTAAPLVRDRSPELLPWLEMVIRRHADWIADERHLGHSNHALHQHQGLFVCARVLKDQQLSDLAVERLNALLLEQYDEQGVNAEGAIAYHLRNHIWWEKVLRRLNLEGVARPEAAARLDLAPLELAHATRPDGTLVQLGDTDNDTAAAVNRPETKYVTSDGSEGEPPADSVAVYNAGYVFARSGWGETERKFEEETFFSLSFGSSRRVHGHADGGSLTFSSHGVNWVVDPGKFQYGTSVPRTHFLSRAAHSLVSIEGRTPRRHATVSLVRQGLLCG